MRNTQGPGSYYIIMYYTKIIHYICIMCCIVIIIIIIHIGSFPPYSGVLFRGQFRGIPHWLPTTHLRAGSAHQPNKYPLCKTWVLEEDVGTNGATSCLDLTSRTHPSGGNGINYPPRWVIYPPDLCILTVCILTVCILDVSFAIINVFLCCSHFFRKWVIFARIH